MGVYSIQDPVGPGGRGGAAHTEEEEAGGEKDRFLESRSKKTGSDVGSVYDSEALYHKTRCF